MYKPEVKTLQNCQVLRINPFTKHGLCYLEATFIFTLFSLRIILLDTEDRGKIDTETFCFFYATGFKLQTYLYPNLFSLNVSKMSWIFPGIIHTSLYHRLTIFCCCCLDIITLLSRTSICSYYGFIFQWKLWRIIFQNADIIPPALVSIRLVVSYCYWN